MSDSGTRPTEPRAPLVDFDHWSFLAKTDPDAFEARRVELIDELIEGLPPQRRHRMRCLQWKIDQVRHRAANPMAACIKINEMMWESLLGTGGLRDIMENLSQGNFDPPPKARVLELRAPR
jgi:hypothetical protein